MLKKILFIILGLVLLLVLLLGGFILYAQLTDYKPDEKVEVVSEGNSTAKMDSDSLSFVTWNIGYSGLGPDVDFFYDGGTNVITPKNLVEKYFAGIKKTVSGYKNTDFVLLQEVDQNSKRSHRINEYKEISALNSKWNATFGKNYDVNFVPVPYYEPMGDVIGGLATYTSYQSAGNTRYQFPGNFSWPTGLFFLDRCFLLQRFPTKNGKELIVINTHNSAYDDDGSLKKQQMVYMKEVLIEEYKKGNYVVVGGDWNQTPPGFDNKKFAKVGGEEVREQIPVSFDYMPEGWLWAYDPDVPTNRKVATAYDPAKTFRTVIDFFLLSPNIKLTKVKGNQTNFQYSDHQPVYMEVVLQ